ncbi:cytochrome c family protein [Fundidesulfovibrio butyratiphilus]
MKCWTIGVFIVAVCSAATVAHAKGRYYVGSARCAECHEEQYKNFTKYSKKANSWETLSLMLPKLTSEEVKQCYKCHTTGYGQQGGFVSRQETPDMAQVGCETCHSPGSEHCDTGEKSSIVRRPSEKVCTECHNSQRVESFRFKPLLYSGAH